MSVPPKEDKKILTAIAPYLSAWAPITYRHGRRLPIGMGADYTITK